MPFLTAAGGQGADRPDGYRPVTGTFRNCTPLDISTDLFVRNRISRLQFRFQRKLLLRTINLPQVIDARVFARVNSRPDVVRDGCGEEDNDRNAVKEQFPPKLSSSGSRRGRHRRTDWLFVCGLHLARNVSFLSASK